MATLEIYQNPEDPAVNCVEYRGKIYPFYNWTSLGDKIEAHLTGRESITMWAGYKNETKN